ncbi:hypothetical protein ACIRG5_42575 [Lentzea sp. NPDC102401]|uniref:hypothetical protein n=1 Tax=Lentzea sp. NPDC102401 TaxID=3364128 RepID=UPI00380E12E4
MTVKALVLLLLFTAVLTTSTVLVSLVANPSDGAEVAAGLLRLATAVSWIVLAIFWVGSKILSTVENARIEALAQIAGLAERWGDKLLAAELEARLSDAEQGSVTSIEWLHRRSN